MKLWIAISKLPHKVIYNDEVVNSYTTSSARENLEYLKELYYEEFYNFYEIEQNA